MKHWLSALFVGVTLLSAGCASTSPRYAPGSPGQWGGNGARSGQPWQPPPAPTSTAPPTLVDTALDTIDILVKPQPRRLR